MAARVRPVETEPVVEPVETEPVVEPVETEPVAVATPAPEGYTTLVNPHTEGHTTVPDSLVDVLVESGYVKA